MNRFTGIMKMHVTGKNSKVGIVYLPWFILLISFAVNLAIAIIGKIPIYTGGLASIYIYMFAIGISALNATFPFAIGLNVRRQDYFLGTVATFTAISAFNAILLWLLAIVEGDLIKGWGTQLHFFNLPYLNDGSLLEQFGIYFIIMLDMYFSGLILSSLYRRVGWNGLLITLGVISLFGTIGGFLCTYFNWWESIFRWLGQQSAFALTLWTVPMAVGFALLSWLLLRKATV